MGRIKEWEELTICDNFLFQKVMQNPRICKRLIEKVLHIRLKHITYPAAEKTIEVGPTQKAIRLDVYVETEDGTMIDIEMQTADKSLGWLPKRTRYYQAMIDTTALAKGEDYIDLKQSFVIFICTFDPFPGNGRKIYTFANRCREQEGLELGDEATKIFLNTKGTTGEVDEDIKRFLAYADGKAAEGEFTRDIASEVERLRQHKEMRVEYMTLMMEMKEQRREGREEGRKEGREEGREEGIDLASLRHIRGLMETLHLSAKQAMDAMKIPAAEQEKYLTQV